MTSALYELIVSQGESFFTLVGHALMGFFGLRFIAGIITRTPLSQRPPQAVVTDMCHWLLTPAFRMVSRLVVALVLLAVAVVLGLEAGPRMFQGYGPVAGQPLPLILIELLILQDLASYWVHRLFHTVPVLWRFHAIHHSATDVTWSTTARVHPVNEIFNYAGGVLPCLLLGFPLSGVLMVTPLLMWYAIGAHTPWDPPFGPLRHVFASPRFHRWHHTLMHEGGNKNFGNLFSVWDRCFGTFYLPEGRKPSVFGVDRDPPPGDYLGQLVHPFVRRRAAPPQPAAEPGAPPRERSSTSPEPA